MNGRQRSWLLGAITILLPACAGAAPAEPDALPLLEIRPLAPVRDAAEFSSSGSLTWQAHNAPEPGEPWPTDQQAVAAAIDWLVVHFGALPPEVTLRPTAIDHSASGVPEPESPGDRGHTIVLHQYWRGIRTDRGAVVYLRGQSVTSVTCKLAQFAVAVDSSRAVITRGSALAMLRKLYSPGPGMPALDQLHLAFVWSSGHNSSRALRAPEVLAPQWSIDPNVPLLVDAHTGRVWVDD